MYASDYHVPDEIRRFGWAMLVVHLQKLNWLVDRAEEGGKHFEKLHTARKYLQTLAADGPDDPGFLQWCREALECTDTIMAASKLPMLEVIEGIASDDATPEAPRPRPTFEVIDGEGR